jgi:hypothetical protein
MEYEFIIFIPSYLNISLTLKVIFISERSYYIFLTGIKPCAVNAIVPKSRFFLVLNQFY